MIEQIIFKYAKEFGQKSGVYLSFAFKIPHWVNMEENRQQILNRMVMIQIILYIGILIFVWASWVAFNDLEANGIVRDTRMERFWYSLIFTLLYTASSIWLFRVNKKTHRMRSLAIDKKFQTVEEASQLREQFMANMSHEIRTPLNAILGFTSLLTRADLKPQQRELANNIQNSSETLLTIVNDILDFSKIEAGMLILEKTPFDLHGLLHSVQQMFLEKARAKNLSLDFDLAPDLPQKLLGDPTRVTQIFVNLLSNAIKFTHRGGVLVRARTLEPLEKNQARIQVEVRDTGIGIPGEQIERVFQRFTQSDEQTTRLYGGTGLGLPIVKQLAEAMSGSIQVRSEVGLGSTFTLTLPLELVNDETELAIDAQADEAAIDLPHLRLLVAEDNPMNRRVVELLFEEWKFQYTMVHNGREAVEILRENPGRFDLVFMDIQMPEMDGYEATRQIRQNLGLSLPIIAMTAHALAGEREKCIRLGMNDYISKPFREAEFRQIIAHFAPKHPSTYLLELDRGYLQETTMGNAAYQRELAQIFLTQSPKDLDAIHAALHNKDLLSAAKAAHNMKSTVGYMGFSKNIGQQLAAFEEACMQSKNPKALLEELQEIKAMTEQAKAMIEAEFLP